MFMAAPASDGGDVSSTESDISCYAADTDTDTEAELDDCDSTRTRHEVLGHFVVVPGGDGGLVERQASLTRGGVVHIGRSPQADLVVRGKRVSSTHLRVEAVCGHLLLTPLPSVKNQTEICMGSHGAVGNGGAAAAAATLRGSWLYLTPGTRYVAAPCAPLEVRLGGPGPHGALLTWRWHSTPIPRDAPALATPPLDTHATGGAAGPPTPGEAAAMNQGVETAAAEYVLVPPPAAPTLIPPPDSVIVPFSDTCVPDDMDVDEDTDADADMGALDTADVAAHDVGMISDIRSPAGAAAAAGANESRNSQAARERAADGMVPDTQTPLADAVSPPFRHAVPPVLVVPATPRTAAKATHGQDLVPATASRDRPPTGVSSGGVHVAMTPPTDAAHLEAARKGRDSRDALPIGPPVLAEGADAAGEGSTGFMTTIVRAQQTSAVGSSDDGGEGAPVPCSSPGDACDEEIIVVMRGRSEPTQFIGDSATQTLGRQAVIIHDVNEESTQVVGPTPPEGVTALEPAPTVPMSAAEVQLVHAAGARKRMRESLTPSDGGDAGDEDADAPAAKTPKLSAALMTAAPPQPQLQPAAATRPPPPQVGSSNTDSVGTGPTLLPATLIMPPSGSNGSHASSLAETLQIEALDPTLRVGHFSPAAGGAAAATPQSGRRCADTLPMTHSLPHSGMLPPTQVLPSVGEEPFRQPAGLMEEDPDLPETLDVSGARGQTFVSQQPRVTVDPATAPVRLVFTGIRPPPHFASAIAALGGVLAPDLSACTHVVVAHLTCTPTLLSALAACAWVLSVEWFRQSLACGRWVEEEPYVVAQSQLEKRFSFKLADVLSRRRRLPREQMRAVFRGMSFVLTPDAARPSGGPSALRAIIEHNGGTVNDGAAPRGAFVITTDRDASMCRKLHARAAQYVVVEWLYAAVLRQCLPPPEEHIALTVVAAHPCAAAPAPSGGASPPRAAATTPRSLARRTARRQVLDEEDSDDAFP